MCQPMKSGGLGFCYARDLNKAYLIKVGWNLCTNRSVLWVYMLRSKYKRGPNILPKVERQFSESNLWRGYMTFGLISREYGLEDR